MKEIKDRKAAIKKLLFIILFTISSFAWALPAGMHLNEDGSFKIGEADFAVVIYKASWSSLTNRNWQNRQVKKTPSSFSLTGEINISEVQGIIKESIISKNAKEFSLEYGIKFPSPVMINALHMELSVPVTARDIAINGKMRKLPAEFKEQCVYNNSTKEFSILLAGGQQLTISGTPLHIIIQDNRKFGGSTFSIRFQFASQPKRLTESSLCLNFKITPAVSQEVDLRQTVNRSFSDGRPNSTTPGWTGQGKENDLNHLPSGELKAGYLRFQILNPAENKGRGTIVLGKNIQSGLKESAELTLPVGTFAKAINLLHAAAWLPAGNASVGEILVTFADGSTQNFDVQARRDIEDWWTPNPCSNAHVVWQGKNNKTSVGLYSSSFPLRSSNPRSIRLKMINNKALWMIPALTLTDFPVHFIPLEKKEELKISAGKDWIPLRFSASTVKGSALDFSFLQDAPAGKYGFIKANKNGDLVFEKAPNKKIRLYGVNLCYSANFLDKATVDKTVREFCAQGYNLVRIHHHDTAMLDKNAADSLTLDPEQMDKLDYLFYRMKEHGIYITTDFSTNRNFKPGDQIPMRGNMKQLAPICKAALDNWKEFTRRWMNHKNPYTGLSWGEDPALFCVNLVNEDPLSFKWNTNSDTAQIYLSLFDKWKKANGYNDAAASEAGKPFRKFLQELQKQSLQEMMRFVREELKIKTLLTSLNYINESPLTLLRNEFDLVDNHLYFDHPTSLEKPWQQPFGYQQRCAIEEYATLPRELMSTRIFGKPFIVTEFNYCFPNRYRAEGGPLIGAYSALQNWNGLCRFAWSHGKTKIINPQYPIEGFDAVVDPLARLSDRIAVMMFRRGDVRPGNSKFVWSVKPNIFDSEDSVDFPPAYQKLGLISQIGSTPANSPLDKDLQVLNKKSAFPSSIANSTIQKLLTELLRKKIAVSDTGELRLDAKNKTFVVVSPRSESITLQKGTLSAGILSVKNATSFQTAAIFSLDNKSLAESADLLLIHLTNICNTDAHFGDQEMKVLKNRGHLPLLVYRGKASAELAASHSYRIQALGADGQKLGEISGQFQDRKFRFLLDPGHFPGGVMAYHLTR